MEYIPACLCVTTPSYFKKGCHSQWSILEPKETLVQSLMSDNAPAKTVTVSLWRYDKPAL